MRTTRKLDGLRMVETIDAMTGEVMPGTMVFVPEKKKSPFGKDWFAMAQSAMEFLATRRSDLGEEGFAVFCAVASKLDFENFIQISQTDLAKKIGMQKTNFSRGMKRLSDLGIIKKGPKVGRSQTYQLNPAMGWKGSAKQHFGAMQKAQKMGWKLIDSNEHQEAIDYAEPGQPE